MKPENSSAVSYATCYESNGKEQRLEFCEKFYRIGSVNLPHQFRICGMKGDDRLLKKQMRKIKQDKEEK